MNRLRHRIEYLVMHLLEGDEAWAVRRGEVAILLLVGLAVAGRFLEPFTSGERWLPGLMSLAQSNPLGFLIPVHFVAALLELVTSFFTFQALRYWLAPLVALVWGLTLGALYLQRLLGFSDFGQALDYLRATLLGDGYPTLVIEDGKKVLAPDDVNPLDVIGGPGYLIIRPGNVVALESGDRLTNIHGVGRHFVHRFERIREILDLREVYRSKQAIEATTKDGIPIELREVEATFRLATGRQRQRTAAVPFPFSVQAVRRAVRGSVVYSKGQKVSQKKWDDLVMDYIAGYIRAWIGQRRLDGLTAPTEKDPRAALRAEFASWKVRKELARMGAELVRLNIGFMDTPVTVTNQRLENWQAFWQSHDQVTRAQGEAVRVAYAELGRAEGQAEMLKKIALALETSLPGGATDETEAYQLVLLRLGQLLEAMAVPGLEEPAASKPPEG